MFNDNSVLSLHVILPLLARFVNEVLQQGYQNLQLATGVHHENSDKTNRAYGYGVHDERGKELHCEYHLVTWAGCGVQNFIVECEGQRAHRHIVTGDGLVCGHGAEDAVREHAAVHEHRGEQRDEPTDSGVPQHQFALFVLCHDPPIRLDVLEASAYITDMRQQGAIFETRQHPIAKRSEFAHFRVHVLVPVQENA